MLLELNIDWRRSGLIITLLYRRIAQIDQKEYRMQDEMIIIVQMPPPPNNLTNDCIPDIIPIPLSD